MNLDGVGGMQESVCESGEPGSRQESVWESGKPGDRQESVCDSGESVKVLLLRVSIHHANLNTWKRTRVSLVSL